MRQCLLETEQSMKPDLDKSEEAILGLKEATKRSLMFQLYIHLMSMITAKSVPR